MLLKKVMTFLLDLFKKLILAALGVVVLGLGVILIFIERRTNAAEEQVKSWKTSTCQVLDVRASDESFYIQCQYQIDGQTYQVKNKTPSLNPYFNAVGSRNGKVVVTVVDSHKRGHFYEFQKGGTAPFWYEPGNPANSVLIPYAASLRGFFYFGILYYVGIAAIFFLARNKIMALKGDH